MKKIKCTQMKCGFNQFGGCRPCDTCNCPPHEINEDCDRCWNCMKDEGVLRWEDDVMEEREEEKQKEDVEVVMVR